MKKVLQWKDGWSNWRRVAAEDLVDVGTFLSFPAPEKLLSLARAVTSKSQREYLGIRVELGPLDRTAEWKQEQRRFEAEEEAADIWGSL